MVICKSLSWTCEFAGFPTYTLVLVLAPVQDLTLLLVIISCFPFFLITSCWGQDAPPLFLSSWLLKIADPLPPVLVWVSFLSGCYALQWVSAAGEGCLCLCRCPLPLRGCWYLMSSFTEMLLFLIPLVHFLGERAWDFENTLALLRLLHMALEFISGSCLQQLWSLLTAWERFLLFPSILHLWMSLLIGRTLALSASSYLVSLILYQHHGYLLYLGGDNSTRLVLLRFS